MRQLAGRCQTVHLPVRNLPPQSGHTRKHFVVFEKAFLPFGHPLDSAVCLLPLGHGNIVN